MFLDPLLPRFNNTQFSNFALETQESDFFSTWEKMSVIEREIFLQNSYESLIKNYSQFLSFPINKKFLSQILGSHIIAETPLEGITSHLEINAFDYLLDLLPKLKFLKHDIPIAKVIHAIQNLKCYINLFKIEDTPLDRAVERIIDKVTNLPINESFVLPFGWSTHFMITEIERTSESCFNFRVFNTGAGSFYHPTFTTYKVECQGFLEFLDIPIQDIACPVFWETYFDLYQDKYLALQKVKPKDIYNRFLYLLNKPPTVARKDIMKITPPISGVCFWNCLKDYFKFAIGKEASKEIFFQIEFLTLLNFFQNLVQSGNPLSSTDIEMLQWGKEKIARSFDSIKENYFKDNAAELEVASEDIFAIIILNKKIDTYLNSYSAPQKICAYSISEWMNNNAIDKEFFTDNDLQKKTLWLVKKDSSLVKPQNFLATPAISSNVTLRYVKTWGAFLRKISLQNVRCFNLISYFIENLPLPHQFTSSSITVAEELSKIFVQYIKVVGSTLHIYNQKKQAFQEFDQIFIHVYHLYSLIEKIYAASLLQKYQINLFQYKIPFPVLDVLFNDANKYKLQLETCKKQKDYEEIRNYYLLRNNSEQTLFDYSGSNSRMYFSIEKDSDQKMGDFALITDYLKKQPGIEKKINAVVSEAYMLAYAFTKNFLPVEYFTLRDLVLRVNSFSPQSTARYLSHTTFFYSFSKDTSFTATRIPIMIASEKLKEAETKNPEYSLGVYLNSESRIHDLLFSKYKTIYPEDLQQFTQNKGLCGEAKRLLKNFRGASEYITQKFIEIAQAEELKLHFCLQLFAENLTLFETHADILIAIFKEYEAYNYAISIPFFYDELELYLLKLFNAYSHDYSKIEVIFNIIQLVFTIDNLSENKTALRQKLPIIDLLNHVEAYLLQKLPLHEDLKKLRVNTIIFFSNHKTLSEEEAIAIISNWLCINLDRENTHTFLANKYFISLERPLEMAIEKNPHLLHACLAKSMPDFTTEGQWQGKFPAFSCGNVRLDIVQGKIYVNDMAQGSLPAHIDAIYKNYFNFKTTPTFSFVGDIAKSSDNKIFIDAKKNIVKLILNNFSYYLLKWSDSSLQIAKDSYNIRFLPQVPNKLWFGKNDGDHLYEVEFFKEKKGKPCTIKDLRNNYYLINLTSQINTLPTGLAKLSNISLGKNIFAWMENTGGRQTLRSIVLPNYNLILECRHGSLIVKKGDYQGAILLTDRPAIFNKFHNYLHLKKDDQEFILIPNCRFILSSPEKNTPLDFKVHLLDGDSQLTFIKYKIQKSSIIADSLVDKLQLAFIYCLSEEYEKSHEMLKNCWKDTAYTVKELDYFSHFDFSFFNDKSKFHKMPNLYAILCYTSILILLNKKLNFNRYPENTNFFNRTYNYYFFYLRHLNAISSKLALSKANELEIIRFLKKKQIHEYGKNCITFRYQQLLDEEISVYHYNTNSEIQAFGKSKNYFFREIPFEIVKELTSNQEIPFFTNIIRPEITFPKHFLHYFQHVLSSNFIARKRAFRDLLYFDCILENINLYSLQILFHIYLNSELFHGLSGNQQGLIECIRIINNNLPLLKTNFESFFYGRSSNTLKAIYPEVARTPLLGGAKFLLQSPLSFFPNAKNKEEEELLSPLKPLSDKFLQLQILDNQSEQFPLQFSRASLGYTLIQHSQFARDFYSSLKSSYENSHDFKVVCKAGKKEFFKLQRLLEIRKRELSSEIKRLKNQTEKDCNNFLHPKIGSNNRQEEIEALYFQLKMERGQFTPILLKDCLISLLKNSFENWLKQKNPFLPAHKIGELKKAAATYAWHKVELKQTKDCLKHLKKYLSTECKDEQKCISLLYQTMQFTNSPSLIEEEPSLLALQVLMGVNFRSKQKEIINKCIQEIGTHFLFQLHMGEGKSSVIKPALSCLFAKDDNIVMHISPANLLNQDKADLKRVCGKFDQKVYDFFYNRSTDCNISTLTRLLYILEAVKRGKHCTISTPEHLQGLFLSYIEYKVCKDTLEQKYIKDLLEKIINIISINSIGIGDEAHKTLYCLKELVLTINEGRPMNTEQWQVGTKVYKILSKEFEEFLKTNLGRNFKENGPNWVKIKDILIIKMMKTFFPISEEHSLYQPVVAYLKGESKDTLFLDELDKVNSSLAKEIIRLKEHLASFLPFSFSQILMVTYGPNADDSHAIPYMGNNAPHPHSDFSHEYVFQNLTIQMYLQLGLSYPQFKQWLGELKRLWFKEINILEELDENSKVKKIIKNVLSDSFDIASLNLQDESSLSSLFLKFRLNKNIIFDFLEKWVFPQCKIHDETLNSTATDIVDILMKKFITFTGTPYNLQAMPQKLIDNSQLDVTSQGNLLHVLSDPKNQKVFIAKSADLKNVFLAIRAIFKAHPNLRVITDLGCIFHGIKNSTVAQLLFKALPSMEEIVIFDDETEEMVLKTRSGQTKYDREMPLHDKRFTYLDHLRSFGADIPQAIDSHQLVTFSQNTLFYECVQADKRMRQLEFGQQVLYMTFLDDAKEISKMTNVPLEKLRANELKMHAIVNEIIQTEKEILISSMQKLFHIAKEHIYHSYIKEKSDISDVKSYLINFFVQKHEDDPMTFKDFEILISPKELLLKYKEAIMLNHSHFLTEEQNAKMDQLIDCTCALLPELISSKAITGMQKTVQKQEEKTLKKEALLIGNVNITPFKEITWPPHILLNETLFVPFPMDQLDMLNPTPKFFSLNEWMVNHGMPNIFSPNLLATQNFLKSIDSKSPGPKGEPLKAIRYFVHTTFASGDRFLLVSLQEAVAIYNFYKNLSVQMSGKKFYLRDIYGKAILDYGSLEGRAIESKKQLEEVLVQIMFFDAREFYKKEQLPLLEQWSMGIPTKALEDTFELLYRNRHGNKDFGSGNLFSVLYKKRKTPPPPSEKPSPSKRQRLETQPTEFQMAPIEALSSQYLDIHLMSSHQQMSQLLNSLNAFLSHSPQLPGNNPSQEIASEDRGKGKEKV